MKIKFPWEQHLINVINKEFPKRHADHDIYHSFRVINLARKLQETYGGDDEVLTASAYLHDLGNDIDRINHVTHSLVIAQHLLRIWSAKFTTFLFVSSKVVNFFVTS